VVPVRAITWSDYMNGRDKAYAEELTLEVARNARNTIEVANRVLAAMAADGVDLAGVHVASGWRPSAINLTLEKTANAAAHSKHLTAEACDLADLPGPAPRALGARQSEEALRRRRARDGAAAVDPDLAAPADGGAVLRALQVHPLERAGEGRGAAGELEMPRLA
jgi:hypothetical protein